LPAESNTPSADILIMACIPKRMPMVWSAAVIRTVPSVILLVYQVMSRVPVMSSCPEKFTVEPASDT
jgi:hypothetical protein